MILTEEMQHVMDIVKNTNEHVFVTGKAGAGKTTFLKHLIRDTKKKCIVAAPTAGSCGVIPAVFITVQEEKGYTDETKSKVMVAFADPENATVRQTINLILLNKNVKMEVYVTFASYIDDMFNELDKKYRIVITFESNYLR